jgi:hypothetical protein
VKAPASVTKSLLEVGGRAVAVAAVLSVVGCNALSGADDLQSSLDQPDTDTRGSALPRDGIADAGSAHPTSDAGTSAKSSGSSSGAKLRLACDGRTCSGSTPYCCQNANGRASCVATEAQCEGALLKCDGPDACGKGEACCAVEATSLAMCVPAAACVAGAGEVLCERDGDCAGSLRCTGQSRAFDHSVCE